MASPLRRPEGMSDDELAAMLGEHETRSIGYYESEIASQQADAIARYFRRPYGNERDGRSQVVDATVAITVDNALAAVLKPFVSSDETVVFEPKGPEDEEQADQATDFVNYVLHNDNDGFRVLHDWFKDALLCKLGVVKVYWEDKTRSKKIRLENLDPQQVLMLQEEGAEVYGPDERGLLPCQSLNRGGLWAFRTKVNPLPSSSMCRRSKSPFHNQRKSVIGVLPTCK